MASKVYRDIHEGVSSFGRILFDLFRNVGEAAVELCSYGMSLEWWRPWMREFLVMLGGLISLMVTAWQHSWDSHFWYWVLPILVVQSFVLFIAYICGPRTRQVLLGLVGIHWSLAIIWVEALLFIWYPGFDWEGPPSLIPKRYLPFCDFSDSFRCSTFIMSPYGRILRMAGVSAEGTWMDFANPTLGVIFYLCHVFYPLLKWMDFPVLPQVGLFTTGFVAAVSIYYSYALVFVINEVCVPCVVTYIINFLLLYVMHGIYLEEQGAADEITRKCD